MNNPIASAIKQISDDKGIPQEQVVEALEAALAAAYRKDFGKKNDNIKVEFDIKTAAFRVFDIKEVVEDFKEGEEIIDDETMEEDLKEGEEPKRRFNPKTQITFTEACVLKPDAVLGEEIRTELIAPDFNAFGRMATQTAKQVLIQKDREAERSILFNQFKEKQDTIAIGTVQRREEHRVLVDFGKVSAVMPLSEQIPKERYNSGDRIKVYVVSVQSSSKGPEIIVSRAHPGMVKKIFEAEIPEIAHDAIEIKAVSREAGNRAKVAVVSHQDAIDPIGSCIGQRGSRIQTIVAELGGEKVDLILFDEDPIRYISNALSPAKVISIELDEQARLARVLVASDQLSLAIGKAGQNVRLASQLTGWNIEVRARAEEGVLQEHQEESSVVGDVKEGGESVIQDDLYESADTIKEVVDSSSEE
ncbi:transcription termination/antitermination protein NusA [Candidatus Uhrbacteria bacterium]|nr:transcription termination/antitermination protein NusA [Candidatus Uhrbacteria bacterium]